MAKSIKNWSCEACSSVYTQKNMATACEETCSQFKALQSKIAESHHKVVTEWAKTIDTIFKKIQVELAPEANPFTIIALPLGISVSVKPFYNYPVKKAIKWMWLYNLLHNGAINGGTEGQFDIPVSYIETLAKALVEEFGEQVDKSKPTETDKE